MLLPLLNLISRKCEKPNVVCIFSICVVSFRSTTVAFPNLPFLIVIIPSSVIWYSVCSALSVAATVSTSNTRAHATAIPERCRKHISVATA